MSRFDKVGEYLNFIQDRYNIHICIKDFCGFIPINKELDGVMRPFLAHTNPFCMYIKQDKDKYFDCLSMIRKMYNKCDHLKGNCFGKPDQPELYAYTDTNKDDRTYTTCTVDGNTFTVQTQKADGTVVDTYTAQAKQEADKAALQAAITAVGNLHEQDYTAESWKMLADALTAATAVNDTKYALQAEVDTAAQNLLAAISDLKAKDNNNGSNPDNPNQPNNPGQPAANPVQVTDCGTGVSITADAGILPEATQLEVQKVTSGEAYNRAVTALQDVSGKIALFDISLLLNGDKIQPQSGTVTVRIPIPDGFDRSKLALYYIADDGTKTSLEFTIDGNDIVFTTTHFSCYAITDTSVPGTGTTPNTGEASTGVIPVAALLFLSVLSIGYLIWFGSLRKKQS